MPGYALVNLAARAKNLWRTLDVTLSCDNLFGKAYHDPAPARGVPGDYPRPGRRMLAPCELQVLGGREGLSAATGPPGPRRHLDFSFPAAGAEQMPLAAEAQIPLL